MAKRYDSNIVLSADVLTLKHALVGKAPARFMELLLVTRLLGTCTALWL